MIWTCVNGKLAGFVTYFRSCKNLDTTFLLCLQDLKDFMRQAGEVTYADAHKNRRNEGWARLSFFF